MRVSLKLVGFPLYANLVLAGCAFLPVVVFVTGTRRQFASAPYSANLITEIPTMSDMTVLETPVRRQAYAAVTPYITKDGSVIRELMHPAVHGNQLQSLAEATVQPGQRTQLHRHLRTEELYHITAGSGRMTLADSEFTVAAGDTICIPPGTPHCIAALGDTPLTLLCCCAPAYDHADTELLEAAMDNSA